MEILTERLLLKRYDNSCITDYFRLKSCAVVWDYSTFVPMESIREAECKLNKMIVSQDQGEAGFLALYRRDNKQFIGESGIIARNSHANRCEIGYNLLPEFWNQGFATEIAVSLVSHGICELGYERVEALVLSDNKASCRVLEKAGFQCEGVLRHFNKSGNKYRDVNYYGLISSDIKFISHSE